MTLYKIKIGKEETRTTSKVEARHVAENHDYAKVTPDPTKE